MFDSRKRCLNKGHVLVSEALVARRATHCDVTVYMHICNSYLLYLQSQYYHDAGCDQ